MSLTFPVQARHGDSDVRVLIAGFEPGRLGEPPYLVAGRPIAKIPLRSDRRHEDRV